MIFHKSSGVADWQSHLADPAKQWREGYSAMACAQSWEKAQGFPPEIQHLFPDLSTQIVLIEHKTKLPGRGGRAQSDVFVLAAGKHRQMAMAVEAKVAESFDKTVEEWLAGGGENRMHRLSGLCDLLDVEFPPDPRLRYQLFSRTAAAIVEAEIWNRSQCAMIVQSFSPAAKWKGDFLDFAKAMGAIKRGDIWTKELKSGLLLSLGWAQGDPKFLTDLNKDT